MKKIVREAILLIVLMAISYVVLFVGIHENPQPGAVIVLAVASRLLSGCPFLLINKGNNSPEYLLYDEVVNDLPGIIGKKLLITYALEIGDFKPQQHCVLVNDVFHDIEKKCIEMRFHPKSNDLDPGQKECMLSIRITEKGIDFWYSEDGGPDIKLDETQTKIRLIA